MSILQKTNPRNRRSAIELKEILVVMLPHLCMISEKICYRIESSTAIAVGEEVKNPYEDLL